MQSHSVVKPEKSEVVMKNELYKVAVGQNSHHSSMKIFFFLLPGVLGNFWVGLSL